MKLLNNVEIKKNNITLSELRKMVRQQRNELNVRLMDVTADDINLKNAQMIITTGTIRNGKVMTDKPIEFYTKADAIKAYNEYTRVLNADTSTKQYHELVKQSDVDALKRFNKARRENQQKQLTMKQFQEYINIRDKFYDLFDGEYYRDVIESVKEVRKKYKGKRSFIDYLYTAQKENPKGSQKEIYDRAVEMVNLNAKTMKDEV